jgi:hypothetical protein
MDDDFTALGDTFIQLVGSNEKPKEPTVAERIDEEYRRRKYGPGVGAGIDDLAAGAGATGPR